MHEEGPIARQLHQRFHVESPHKKTSAEVTVGKTTVELTVYPICFYNFCGAQEFWRSDWCTISSSVMQLVNVAMLIPAMIVKAKMQWINWLSEVFVCKHSLSLQQLITPEDY